MSSTSTEQGLSRRELLASGAVAGAGLALAGGPAALAAPLRRRARGKRVAVLGGGMAGLTAAHELIERGYEVTVFERRALGGKARSMGVPGSAEGGRRALPGEHGFRFFPGFYHHVPDTMRRIPFPGNPNGVWDNFVDANDMKSSRAGGRSEALLFGAIPDPRDAFTPGGLERLLVEEFAKQQGIRPHEAEFFVNRLMVFLTSSDERRYGQWEHTSWWDFVRAANKSEEYKKVLARGLTRTLVATKEEVASTRTIGNMAEAFVMNIMGRGNDGAPDRVLNAPTNEAWIDPWVKLLRRLGVRFELGQSVARLEMRDGEISAAIIRDRKSGRLREVGADWFVAAMPAERVRRLWRRDHLRADPQLELMDELFVDWMSGIQYYLREPVEIVRGHITFVDAPWALTALTQGQFWEDRDFRRDYGDGKVADCLSVDISDWDTPGILYGRPAKRCAPKQVAREVWAQIKAHLEDTGESYLPKGILHSWFLDPGIRWHPASGKNTSRERLLVNTVGTWEKRPTAARPIPNLFLAGDYVQTDIDLATMEGANESARAATAALLDAAGSKKQPPAMYRLYDPPEFEPAKAIDRELFAAGLPNALDRPE